MRSPLIRMALILNEESFYNTMKSSQVPYPFNLKPTPNKSGSNTYGGGVAVPEKDLMHTPFQIAGINEHFYYSRLGGQIRLGSATN